MVTMDKVNNNIQFDTLKRMVKVSYMFAWSLHELVDVIISHRNNNLLA